MEELAASQSFWSQLGRTAFASGLVTVVLAIDIAYRYLTTGTLEPLARSLAAFSVSGILVAFITFIVSPNTAISVDPLLVGVFIGLLAVWLASGASYRFAKQWADNDIEAILRNRLKKAEQLPFIVPIAREFLNVDFYGRNGLLRHFSGNRRKRRIFWSFLTDLNLLTTCTSNVKDTFDNTPVEDAKGKSALPEASDELIVPNTDLSEFGILRIVNTILIGLTIVLSIAEFWLLFGRVASATSSSGG